MARDPPSRQPLGGPAFGPLLPAEFAARKCDHSVKFKLVFLGETRDSLIGAGKFRAR